MITLDSALTEAIQTGSVDFDALALALFAVQFAQNVPYQRLCKGRGLTPETVTRWQDIPPVPAAAFKYFALTCVPEKDCPVVFHSSGTTSSETSRHFLSSASVEVYRTSLRAGFTWALPYAPQTLLALMPPPSELPHSSLSFMLEALCATFFTPDSLAEHLRENYQPVTVFGTAFAFMHLFDGTDGERFALPHGSTVIETGGFKGRSREVSREALYGLFVERLGVPLNNCYSEYGMSELASQFYSRGLDGPKQAPPWLRTRLLDPVTGTDAAPGTPGLLTHYDLANLNSVLAIQTEDLGIEVPGGFQLLGRAPGAVLRGCSLTMEELR